LRINGPVAGLKHRAYTAMWSSPGIAPHTPVWAAAQQDQILVFFFVFSFLGFLFLKNSNFGNIFIFKTEFFFKNETNLGMENFQIGTNFTIFKI
jgi:hypothetical protein